MNTILIDDNVDSMKVCLNCGNPTPDSFPTCHNTEFQKDTDKRELFLIFDCFKCNNHMVSYVNKSLTQLNLQD